MMNSTQLKALIKNIASKNKISPQLVLQNYMLERFLERISLSSYRNNFVIKGGFLIASIIGLNFRATMDMDATIKRYHVNAETVMEMVEQIITVPLNDSISFTVKNVGKIREDCEYAGFRVFLIGNYEKMAVPLKLDITTGDKITPCEIEYQYKLMFEDRAVSVLAYNLSTILAEKIESVLSRGEQSTRLRDYYDIYILAKLQSENINFSSLKEALVATSGHRGSLECLKHYKKIMSTVISSQIMNLLWSNYQKDFDYASDLDFSDVCNTVVSLMDNLGQI